MIIGMEFAHLLVQSAAISDHNILPQPMAAHTNQHGPLWNRCRILGSPGHIPQLAWNLEQNFSENWSESFFGQSRGQGNLRDLGVPLFQGQYFNGFVIGLQAGREDEPIQIEVIKLSWFVFDELFDFRHAFFAILEVDSDYIQVIFETQVSAGGNENFLHRQEIEVMRDESYHTHRNFMIINLFVEKLEVSHLGLLHCLPTA